jgi:hypothetical protein
MSKFKYGPMSLIVFGGVSFLLNISESIHKTLKNVRL